MDIKRLLASKRIPCSIEDLEYGLVNLDLDNSTMSNLPKGGEMLLQNPFSQIKKKKGKKKEKKE